MESQESKKSQVFKDWYDKNKEDLAAKRRERYRNDPEYRRNILERGEKYRKKVRNIRAKVESSRTKIQPNGSRLFQDENGTEWELYTISSVADAVGRSVQCVNRWDTMGYIPQTPFRYSRVRLFTEDMIDALSKVVGKYRRIPDPGEFEALVKSAWGELNLPSSPLLSPVKD